MWLAWCAVRVRWPNLSPVSAIRWIGHSSQKNLLFKTMGSRSDKVLVHVDDRGGVEEGLFIPYVRLAFIFYAF
jgi:hypothetical protein